LVPRCPGGGWEEITWGRVGCSRRPRGGVVTRWVSELQARGALRAGRLSMEVPWGRGGEGTLGADWYPNGALGVG